MTPRNQPSDSQLMIGVSEPSPPTQMVFTLPETKSSPPKMDGWNTTFLLGRPIFRGKLLVSGGDWIL